MAVILPGSQPFLAGLGKGCLHHDSGSFSPPVRLADPDSLRPDARIAWHPSSLVLTHPNSSKKQVTVLTPGDRLMRLAWSLARRNSRTEREGNHRQNRRFTGESLPAKEE